MKRYEILVVDDEKMVADALQDSLEFFDIYKATVTYSGKEALEKIKNQSFEAYMIDQRMPEMTGIELIKELLKIDQDPLIYLITAEDDGIALAVAEKTRDQGGLPIKRYVSKPWIPSLFSVDLREDLREREIKNSMLETLAQNTQKQKLIQKELSRAQDKLTAKLKHDAALAGAFSIISSSRHELSNIHTGITSNVNLLVSLLKDFEGETHPSYQKITKIRTRLGTLSERLRDYVNFIGLLTKKSKDPATMVSVTSVIEMCLADCSLEIQNNNIDLVKEYFGEVEVMGCENQLKYAFYHIIKNSIEAMPEGGTLLLSTTEQNNHGIVKFEDTGKGIPEDILEKVFIPLFTQDKIYGGRGCSIVHKVITDFHKGQVNIESYTANMINSGRYSNKAPGTIVTISLPLST